MRLRYLALSSGFVLSILGMAWTHIRRPEDVRPGYPLRFDATSYDFGTLKWTDLAKHVFHFTNTSNKSVLVASTQAGCACTEPEISGRMFRPGESGTLIVRFNPDGLHGAITKPAQITLEGFLQPVEVSIKARVDPLLTPFPQQIDLGMVSALHAQEATITLKNTSGRPVTIQRIACPDYIHVQQTTASLHKRDPVLTLGLSVPPVGLLVDTIKIYTSLPERPEIEVLVRGNVLSKWTQSRADFYIGFVNIGEHMETSVILHGIMLSQITSVTTDFNTSKLPIRLASVPNGVQAILSLDFSHASAGQLSNSVFLKTTDREQPVIRIPVTGIVQDPNNSNCCMK